MVNGHGGRRPGAGRKPGSKLTKTQLIAAKAREAGISPLEYMLSVMRDPTADPERRDKMAAACAPYIHPKLASIQHYSDDNAAKNDNVTLHVSFVSSPNAEAPMIDATPSATLLPPARSEPPSPAVPATPRKAAPAAPVCDIRITERLPVQDSRGFSGRR